MFCLVDQFHTLGFNRVSACSDIRSRLRRIHFSDVVISCNY